MTEAKFCRCGNPMLPSYDKEGKVLAQWVCQPCGVTVPASPTVTRRGQRSAVRGSRQVESTKPSGKPSTLPGLGHLPPQKKAPVDIDPKGKGSHLELMLEAQLKQLKCGGFIREYQFAKPRLWRFDFCWPHIKLAVEAEGGTWNPRMKSRHTSAQGYQNDATKYNAAAIQGWTVLRYTSKDITRGNASQEIAMVVAQKTKEEARKNG